MFSNLDWPKDVPKELYWEVMEQIHRQQIREIKAAKAYHQGMEKLKSGYRDALHELIGSDKLKRYKRLHKARIYKLRKAAKQLADTPEKLQQREALRLRLVNESKKTIEKSGVDTAKITALRTSYDKKVSGLFARTVGKGKMGEVIPKPDNEDFPPPYLIGTREYDHYESEAGLPNPSFSCYNNPVTGDVGSRTYIHVSGADDWDLVSATCRTGFFIIYHTPRTGVLELNLDLEIVNLNAHGSIRDECGRSSADVRQRCRLFGQVYTRDGFERTYDPTYLIDRSNTLTEADWFLLAGETGTDLNRSFRLATPVPANTVVWITVGVETFNLFRSNDCTIHSTLEARLLARRIGVTTTT